MAQPLKKFFDKAKDKSEALAEAERKRQVALKAAEDARIAAQNAGLARQQERANAFTPFLDILGELKSGNRKIFVSRTTLESICFKIRVTYKGEKDFDVFGASDGDYEVRRSDNKHSTYSGMSESWEDRARPLRVKTVDEVLDHLSDWVGVVATPDEIQALAKLAEQEPPAPPKATKNYKM